MATDNYLDKLNRAIEGLELPPGSRTHVFVQHDDWCQFLRGKRCNCNPTLKFVREDESIH